MPTGFLFITIHFTSSDILLIILGGLVILAVNLAAVVLPLMALGALLKRRWRRALILALIAAPVTGWCVWPIIRDYWAFRQAVAEAEAIQVTRAVPDLTGKVVAFLVDDISPGGMILECDDLLHHSGAAKIYLLRRRAAYTNSDDAPDWRGTVDLTHWIVGEAVSRKTKWATPDDPPRCLLAPTESGLRVIDYFIARDIPLYNDDAPQGIVPERLLHGYGARLEEYFAPVADQHSFRIVAEIADLIRVPVSSMDEGLPRPVGTVLRSWPSSEREFRDYRAPIRAALCRYATESCLNY